MACSSDVSSSAQALLPGEAQHKHIRGDGIAEQRGCDAGCVEEAYAVPGGLPIACLMRSGWSEKSGL